MKRGTVAPFKFGQSKVSKRTYFPSMPARPASPTSVADAALEKRRQGDTSGKPRTFTTPE